MGGSRASPLLDTVRRTIQRHGMFRPAGPVVVGVSGGPDSVCLLHALWRLRAELGLELVVGHLNHGFRPEAAAEAAFVAELAGSLGVPAVVEEADVPALSRRLRLSAQVAARRARLEFLGRVARERDAAWVALGHQRDDQAETVLMWFLRGTGLDGLAGIPPVRRDGGAGVWLARPLLEVDRAAIEAYCRAEGLQPRRDPSNRRLTYTRNRIRLALVPLLEREYQPGLRSRLAALADAVRGDRALLEQLTDEAWAQALLSHEPSAVTLSVPVLVDLPPGLRRRVLRRAAGLVRAAWTPPLSRVDAALDLLQPEGAGCTVELGAGVLVRREAGRLHVTTAPRDKVRPYAYALPVPGSVNVVEAGVRITARLVPAGEVRRAGLHLVEGGALDYNKVALPLEVRNRRRGDRFVPLGMTGSKKLKDFLIGLKVPRSARDRLPLVTAGGQVVWVAGYRIDDRVKVGPDTRTVLVLEQTPLGEPTSRAGGDLAAPTE